MNPKQLQRESKVVWFEIPVTNLSGPRAFMNRFRGDPKKDQIRLQTMGVFPYEAPAISGCVVYLI